MNMISRLKRRQFLQFSGSTLATLGLSQLDLGRQVNHYNRALAQNTPRKLGLLVGLNQYSELSGIRHLNGCLTDVEMQYELLVHRYGFNPSDIVVLTDGDASRDRILSAFENHLIDQAKAEDVVVFHFSGHGSRVLDPEPIPDLTFAGGRGYNGTLVSFDARDRRAEDVDDIMGKTLFLLTHALQTENVTTIIDSCYSGGTRAEFSYRVLDEDGLRPSAIELDYQDQWRQRLGLSPEQLQTLRSRGIAKGVTLGSAQKSQLAADARFDGFHAGAFTYTLTHYLWQQTSQESLDETFTNLARRTRDVAQSAHIEQDPVAAVKPDSNHGDRPLYFIQPTSPAAEAVVRREQNGDIEFWLGGVSSQSVVAFQSGAIFNLIDTQGNAVGQIEQTDRSGLVGYGKLSSGTPTALSQGSLLREKVRGVPPNLQLRVGLLDSLGSELEVVRSRLNDIDQLEPVAIGQDAGPHYLLGRMTEAALEQARERQISEDAIGTLGSLGLFTPGLTPIAGSFSQSTDESIDAALDRLRPRMKMLLAGRILRAVLNSDTSNLNVDVAVEAVSGNDTFARSASRAAEEAGIVATTVESGLQQLTPGTEIQIKVTNHESQSLYLGIIVISSTGEMTVLHPIHWDQPAVPWNQQEESAFLQGNGQSITIPQRQVDRDRDRDYCAEPDSQFSFCVEGPAGFFEILILASSSPLRDAFAGLQYIAAEIGVRSGEPLGIPQEGSVDVITQLLGDLDEMSRGGIAVQGNVRAVDTEKLAALSVILEVVEP
ncbi:MAG: caspase family protein [Cyanobacteria bacterium P01_A01_bin.123]